MRDAAKQGLEILIRLIKDVFSSAVTIAAVAALLLIAAVTLLALPVFIGCWLLVRFAYWLASRVPMWLDADRINLGRIHCWPWAGNLLLCLAILGVSWLALRRIADAIVRAYLDFLWGRVPESLANWIKAHLDAVHWPWLSDRLLALQRTFIGWDGQLSLHAVLLHFLMIVATIVVLLQVTGDAKRLKMIEKV